MLVRRGPFVGRVAELAALERQYRRAAPALLPVYGRRRIGKSELLVRFCAGKRSIYFAATQGTAVQQMRAFMRCAADALGEALLAELAVTDWERALTVVMERAGRGRLVLVLDEFQWLCESSPELPSVIQKLWDHQWQHQKAPFVVLCGSYIGFMEREVLGQKSPLFGRRTGQLLIEPFGYREAALFHPRWSVEEQAKAFFVCGGVPAYLKAFDPARSVEQNIIASFLEVDAPLFREAEFLLREELRDVSSYSTLIEAMAQGTQTPTEMSRWSALPTSQLMYFLNNLVRLGYVDKRLPLVPGHASRKATRYAIGDPLLRFWYRFVAPHYSAIRREPGARSYLEHVRPSLDAFWGAGFEGLCREALPELLRAEGVSASVRAGEYWSPRAQIDVVGLRGDRWIELGECKWSERGSLPGVFEELRAKGADYPAAGATVQWRIFTRKPWSKRALAGVRVHSLGSLYEL